MRTLLFLGLVFWMALAGALLLETIVISLGAETADDAGIPASGFPLEGFLQAYRLFVSTAALLFGYHCLSRREWARRAAVALLATDLLVWLTAALHSLLVLGRFDLGLPRMILQVIVILFEVGLLRLLLNDTTKRDFQSARSGVRAPKNERFP